MKKNNKNKKYPNIFLYSTILVIIGIISFSLVLFIINTHYNIYEYDDGMDYNIYLYYIIIRINNYYDEYGCFPDSLKELDIEDKDIIYKNYDNKYYTIKICKNNKVFKYDSNDSIEILLKEIINE